MAGRGVDVVTKVAQWKQAYDAILAEFDPEGTLSRSYDLLNTKVAGENSGILELDMQAYSARVNASLGIARLQAANQRAAATVAALITQTGIKPAAIDYGDDVA